jgi:hypothetical protein
MSSFRFGLRGNLSWQSIPISIAVRDFELAAALAANPSKFGDQTN